LNQAADRRQQPGGGRHGISPATAARELAPLNAADPPSASSNAAPANGSPQSSAAASTTSAGGPAAPVLPPGTLFLFLNVFLIAVCGLIYELLAGTLASYVLGDSVTQFSLIIGLYLFAMGIGSWLSGFIGDDVAPRFVEIEFAVALVGGISAPMLFLGFSRLSSFHILLYGTVLVIGTLVGTEIPLMMRLLRDRLEFRDLVARVLAFDYLGALAASVLFPLVFVPRLGLVRTSLVFGLINAAVGLWAIELLKPLLAGRVLRLRLMGVIVATILLAGLIRSERITTLVEDNLYNDEIVHAESSSYQRLIVTRGKTGFSLFLNGNLQFHSADEYRYHEALVHPAMLASTKPSRVLVLGGGDGLALREIFRYPGVERVTLVDLDPAMTALSERYPPLGELNGRSYADPRLEVVHADAFVWLAESLGERRYDVAIIDFPDPDNFALGKLYTTRFYRMLKRALAPGGAVCVQCTSPLVARKSFWCVVTTMESAGFQVRPYQATVPSFGVWGYALAKTEPFPIPTAAPPAGLRFLDPMTMAGLFTLPPDMARPDGLEINRLDNQALVRYYETEWRPWE
jgi:spermidine synthase